MPDENAKRYVRKEIAPLAAIHVSAEQIPSTIKEAYEILRDQVGGDETFGAAWKLGGTTLATRRMFNVNKLYFGPLHESEVMSAPCEAPDHPLFELKGEAEIALRISPKAAAYLSSGGSRSAGAPNANLFDAWCVAVELPSSPVTNLLDVGVKVLVADRCGSGALVLGPCLAVSETNGSNWQGATLRMEQNGKIIAEGGVDALVEPPDVCARNFLKEALYHGFSPKPGQWIATGGLTPCASLSRGALASVFYNGEQALQFTVGEGTA